MNKLLKGQRAIIPAGVFVTDYTNGLNKGIRLQENLHGAVISYAGNYVYLTADNGRKYYTVWNAVKAE